MNGARTASYITTNEYEQMQSLPLNDYPDRLRPEFDDIGMINSPANSLLQRRSHRMIISTPSGSRQSIVDPSQGFRIRCCKSNGAITHITTDAGLVCGANTSFEFGYKTLARPRTQLPRRGKAEAVSVHPMTLILVHEWHGLNA